MQRTISDVSIHFVKHGAEYRSSRYAERALIVARSSDRSRNTATEETASSL